MAILLLLRSMKDVLRSPSIRVLSQTLHQQCMKCNMSSYLSAMQVGNCADVLLYIGLLHALKNTATFDSTQSSPLTSDDESNSNESDESFPSSLSSSPVFSSSSLMNDGEITADHRDAGATMHSEKRAIYEDALCLSRKMEKKYNATQLPKPITETVRR